MRKLPKPKPPMRLKKKLNKKLLQLGQLKKRQLQLLTLQRKKKPLLLH
jgi:hypothetical protein